MLSEHQLANAIRALSMDAVQKANSGHPGAPMGMADIAQVLWQTFLRHNPNNPSWFNRDRFVLSNGHGSMLLYALLHLTGYALDIADIKQFRQLHSKTPGHPEYGYTPGVETTTGPLGQGLSNAVGMAIAEKTLGAQFNQPNFPIIDHFTYVFLGDGCLMEGVSHEACSLAGTLELGKLIAFWDDNGISIDGHTQPWFTDNTPQRFEAYGWQVIADIDGHDPDAIRQAITTAQNTHHQPTLICCKTTIGYGAPNKQGTGACHGAPLGSDEVVAAREKLHWPHPPFEIPKDILQAWDAREKGDAYEQNWQDLFDAYQQQYPKLASELQRRIHGELPENWHAQLERMLHDFNAQPEDSATRKSSLAILNHIGTLLPELLGGSADLTPSNLTYHKSSQTLTPEMPSGNYIHYGVREFGMTSMMTGIALHGGFIPYGGTFLIFMDYARNAVRMAALMQQRAIYVYTHDSIGLGEDGPTHQPIEQLTNLRTTPHMSTWRPCDRVETLVAWRMAIERQKGPTALALSRQTLPQIERDHTQCQHISRGGYILRDCQQMPELILIATGSEVQIALKAHQILTQDDIQVRLVSMPSTDIFLAQDRNYQNQVLPQQVRHRIAIEAGGKDYWYRFVGLDGAVIGLDSFGESAPAADLFVHFHITLEALLKTAKTMLQTKTTNIV